MRFWYPQRTLVQDDATEIRDTGQTEDIALQAIKIILADLRILLT